MRRITTIFGLMLLLWLGASPVAAFTRAESKAASMVTSLQAGHDFPLAAQELLAAFIVLKPKTALRGGGAENQAFTWDVTLVIYCKNKGYPDRIAKIVLGPVVTPDYRAPDIYDPSTFTEPYAYAAGNPMLYWDPDGLDFTWANNSAEDSKRARRMLEKLNNPEEMFITEKAAYFGLGMFGGLVRNSVIGGKDFAVLLYRVKLAQFRVDTSQSLERLFGKGLENIEEDIAYLSLVEESFKKLFVDEGLFQSMGSAGGISLAKSLELINQQQYFDAGVESTEFLEVITLLASLPKAGLSATSQLNKFAAKRVGSSELGNALSGLGRNPLGRNLNTIDEFRWTAAFSGVYDVKSGKFLAYPSGDSLLRNGQKPLNLVFRQGGHFEVNRALSQLLGSESNNRLGFAMVFDNEGNFNVTWKSFTINSKNPTFSGEIVPLDMRQQVLDAIMQSTGRIAR